MTAVPDRTAFRRFLQASLAETFGFAFEAGEIEGPQQDRDIGCVWWEGKRPFSRDGNEEENYYRVRVLRRFQQDQGGTEPRTTLSDHLEQVSEQLEQRLKGILATAGHQFFVVTEVTADNQRQHVEAQLLAYDRNRSSAGG